MPVSPAMPVQLPPLALSPEGEEETSAPVFSEPLPFRSPSPEEPPAEPRHRVFAPRARSLAPEWSDREVEPAAPEVGLPFQERFSGLRGRREEIAETRAAREAAAVPTIRVHIGRIEIRPLGEKPREKARAQESAVSLEDYLRERRRESW